jgi:hypothetical protein
VEENVKIDYDQDIADGLVSQHRITTARIETEHRRQEERRKQHEGDREEETDSVEAVGGENRKGWEVTSVGKLFSP